MKIRVTTKNHEYQGLYAGSEHEVDDLVWISGVEKFLYSFTTNGKLWKLYEGECEEVFPAPNEKLMDVINTDLKKEECRSSYCECEEGKCSGGKVDRRVDKMEKKESVLDIQHGGSHYKDKGIQPIEYITANNLGFCEGNIVKYASRHQDKNGAEDIRKVIHYAQFILKFQYGEDI